MIESENNQYFNTIKTSYVMHKDGYAFEARVLFNICPKIYDG